MPAGHNGQAETIPIVLLHRVGDHTSKVGGATVASHSRKHKDRYHSRPAPSVHETHLLGQEMRGDLFLRKNPSKAVCSGQHLTVETVRLRAHCSIFIGQELCDSYMSTQATYHDRVTAGVSAVIAIRGVPQQRLHRRLAVGEGRRCGRACRSIVDDLR